MKFRLNLKTAGLLFLFLNIILFFVLIYLTRLTSENYTVSITTGEESPKLPVVNQSIEKLRTLSKAFIIYDPASRVVIASKNEKLRFAPASTAKIMTSTIILEEYSLTQVLWVSGLDTVEGSKMNLYDGEGMTVENLLYGLMLPSGNDAAYVLTTNYIGGQSAFIKRMNDRAKELNLTNTRFFDPAGYMDENYTNSFDLARLAAFAIKNPEFAKIVGTKSKTVTDVSGTISHDLSNLNELLGQNGVTGIKTGFTNEAGGVLVTSIKNDDKTYIVVVLNTPDRFGDTDNLIKNAIANLNIVSY